MMCCVLLFSKGLYCNKFLKKGGLQNQVVFLLFIISKSGGLFKKCPENVTCLSRFCHMGDSSFSV